MKWNWRTPLGNRGLVTIWSILKYRSFLEQSSLPRTIYTRRLVYDILSYSLQGARTQDLLYEYMRLQWNTILRERKRKKKIIKRGKNSTWYTEYIRVWRLRGGTLGSASRRSRTPWSQHMPRASDRKSLSTNHEIRSFDESRHCTETHFMAHRFVHKRCSEGKHRTPLPKISANYIRKLIAQKSRLRVSSPSVRKSWNLDGTKFTMSEFDKETR